LAAETLLDGESEALTRKAVDLALAGDVTALRLCLDRILPPRRDRSISFALPAIKTSGDIVQASAAVANAVAEGALTPMEAASLSQLLSGVAKAIEVSEFEIRLSALEAKSKWEQSMITGFRARLTRLETAHPAATRFYVWGSDDEDIEAKIARVRAEHGLPDNAEAVVVRWQRPEEVAQ
jgi:hypothetical protein